MYANGYTNNPNGYANNKDIMVDLVHYLPYVNDEFNNALLNILLAGN